MSAEAIKVEYGETDALHLPPAQIACGSGCDVCDLLVPSWYPSGFPTLLAAYHLKVRAWTMTHLGFEFALYHGAPQNPHCQVFPKGPPCCRMSAIHGPSNGLGASAAYGSANTVVEGTEEDDRLPAFQCEAPSGWKPNLAVPAPCQAEVQLGEDLSYAGERQHCRACHVWEDGWKIAVESSPAFSSRVPDHAWEEWEVGVASLPELKHVINLSIVSCGIFGMSTIAVICRITRI